jgi:hypothetical protein
MPEYSSVGWYVRASELSLRDQIVPWEISVCVTFDGSATVGSLSVHLSVGGRDTLVVWRSGRRRLFTVQRWSLPKRRRLVSCSDFSVPSHASSRRPRKHYQNMAPLDLISLFESSGSSLRVWDSLLLSRSRNYPRHAHVESFGHSLDGLFAFADTLFDATGGQATASSLCCACPLASAVHKICECSS